MKTTNEKPQCGFCGGTEFTQSDRGWVEVACVSCNLWLATNKADGNVAAYEEPNRSTAIKRYAKYTKWLVVESKEWFSTQDDVTKLDVELPDLKPCPFCGTVGRYKYLEQKGRDTWGVRCPRSGCMGGAGPFTGYQWTKEEARDIWNSRYTDTGEGGMK